jgi:8-oxo-dGTP pyrophosphatase MutT (NUDIX family)
MRSVYREGRDRTATGYEHEDIRIWNAAMTSLLRRAWSDYVQPLLIRPQQLQVAALCYRPRSAGVELLLVTSLHNRRWIVPKGWPMKGRNAAETAAAEAWEEAGVVVARLGSTPLGTFRYTKRMRGGAGMPCETVVFPIEVASLADVFPQAARRERRWVSPREAADLLDEPGLREIIAQLPQRLARGEV